MLAICWQINSKLDQLFIANL